jgi:hypothetical protein
LDLAQLVCFLDEGYSGVSSKWEKALRGMAEKLDEKARKKAMKPKIDKGSIRGVSFDSIWLDEAYDIPKSADWFLPEGKSFGSIYDTIRIDKIRVKESTPELVQEEKAKLAEAKASLIGQIQSWTEKTHQEIAAGIEPKDEAKKAFYKANPDFGKY